MDNGSSETQPELTGVLKHLKEDPQPIGLTEEEIKPEIEKFNTDFAGTNTDESLVEVLTQKEKETLKWASTPTEEEKKTVPNPEEEAFFEKLKTKQQEEPIDVVPRPPIARKFRRLIKDADKEPVMSEGEKEILKGYAEDKRKAKDQRVGEYIEGLKKEKEEQDKKFPDIIGDMEKKEPTSSPVIETSSQRSSESSSPTEHQESWRERRLKEGIAGAAAVGIDQLKGGVRTPEPPDEESFVQKLKKIEDAKKEF